MPPFVMSPLLKIAVAALGAAAIAHWLVREVQRINDELDRLRAAGPYIFTCVPPISRMRIFMNAHAAAVVSYSLGRRCQPHPPPRV